MGAFLPFLAAAFIIIIVIFTSMRAKVASRFDSNQGAIPPFKVAADEQGSLSKSSSSLSSTLKLFVFFFLLVSGTEFLKSEYGFKLPDIDAIPKRIWNWATGTKSDSNSNKSETDSTSVPNE